MTEKVESFDKSLRWKAFYFYKEKVHHESEVHNFFGFKSPAAPLQKEHFNSFENQLHKIIQTIEFKTVRNEFLKKLQKDVESIGSLKNMLVFVSKSTNPYKFNDSTTKNFSNITLRKLKKQQILMQKEKLTKNQNNLLIIFLELTTKWNFSLTRRYLQHQKTTKKQIASRDMV